MNSTSKSINLFHLMSMTLKFRLRRNHSTARAQAHYCENQSPIRKVCVRGFVVRITHRTHDNRPLTPRRFRMYSSALHWAADIEKSLAIVTCPSFGITHTRPLVRAKARAINHRPRPVHSKALTVSWSVCEHGPANWFGTFFLFPSRNRTNLPKVFIYLARSPYYHLYSSQAITNAYDINSFA